MKKLTTFVTLAAFMMLGSLAFHGQVQAKTIELKFGHVGAPGSLFLACADEFAKRANAKLGDKAKVVTFGSSQLGKDQELLKKLKLGTITFALPSTVMSSVVDEFGVFEMPYLVLDRNHMRKIRDEVFWPMIAPKVEAKGYAVVAVWENGFRNITNNVKPINGPADLQGVKLRTPKGEWRVKMFKGYGANPTPMALSEVFVALQTGVIDGQENPFTQIYSQNFHEVQKYLSLSGHVYTPAYLLTGKKTWEGLPADVREILKTTAVDMQEWVYETAEKMETDLLDKMKGSVEINEVDKKAFVDASGPIYQEFGTKVPGGKDLIDKVQSLVK
ncbi:MAG: TRAP transporter substrate-binding protein [Desulfobacterales bacterium]|nr:TRAP transporter substrate-binding protein [Deltaproteobacteria bacterium]MBT8361625.1 TRAP transporter substrate-binding protein [Deltaproteobacteria bacterium]NNK94245.1 TRAP transporter substrate-binding protein [Desulfobacterales bacterium]